MRCFAGDDKLFLECPHRQSKVNAQGRSDRQHSAVAHFLLKAGKFGTHLFPETWVIDKRGVIRARFDGQRRWSDPTFVELVDQVRRNGYCEVAVKEGQPMGEGKRICEAITGG